MLITLLPILLLSLFPTPTHPQDPQYHLSKSLKLPLSSPPISLTIISSSQDKLGIIQTKNTQSSSPYLATILTGDNFQNKQRQTNVEKVVSLPKFVNGDIILNYGTNVSIEGNSSRNKAVNVSGGYGRIVAYDQYVLVPQQMQCDTIIKISYSTFKSQTFTYNQSPCPKPSSTSIHRLPNHTLFISRDMLYFLHPQNLSLFQQIQLSVSGVEYINTYVSGSDITILVSSGRSLYSTITWNQNSQSFVFNNQFIADVTNFTIVHTDSAVAVQQYNGSVYRSLWRSISQPYLALSMNQNQSLSQYKWIATSQNQLLFAVYSQIESKIKVYFYFENFYVPKLLFTQNFEALSHLHAQFTRSSQFLIMLTKNYFYSIQISNSSNKTTVDNTNSCQVILMIQNNAQWGDLFVTYCHSQGKYWLQLRGIQLTVLDRYDIQGYGDIESVRLLGNPAWDQNFMVLIKKVDSENNTCIGILMNVQNKQIISKFQLFYDIPYEGSRTCYKYITWYNETTQTMIFHLYYRPSQYSPPSILALPYQPSKSPLPKPLSIQTAGSTILIQIIFQPNMYTRTLIYRVSEQASQNWYKGAIQNVYYPDRVFNQSQVGSFIFDKRMMWYLYAYNIVPNNMEPVKLIYSIQLGQIVQQHQIDEGDVNGSIYIVPNIKLYDNLAITTSHQELQKRDETCPSLFYYKPEPSNFTQFKDCQPYNQSNIFPFQSPQPIKSIQVRRSSSPSYLIFTYQYSESPSLFQSDIRNISDPSKRLFSLKAGSRIYSMDISQTQYIVISKENILQIFLNNNSDDKEQLNLQDIIGVDVGGLGQVIYFGLKKQEKNVSRLVYKEAVGTKGKHYDVGGKIKLIAINYEASLVAVFDSEKLKVFNITKQFEIVLEQEYSNIIELKFTNNYTLLLKKTTGFDILQLQNNIQQAKLQNIIQESMINSHLANEHIISQSQQAYIKLIVSKTGKFVAATRNGTTVQLTSRKNQKRIVNFKMPQSIVTRQQDKVSDLAFLNDDSLMIMSQTGMLYFLYPAKCPPTFYNDDGFCVCANQNQYQNNDTNRCETCNFMCKKCENPGFSCSQFSIIFFLIVVGVPALIVIIIVVVCVIRFRKNKKGKKNVLLEIEEQQYDNNITEGKSDNITESRSDNITQNQSLKK